MINARCLAKETGYKQWRNFNNLVLRADHLIRNGLETGTITNSIYIAKIGKGAKREIFDYILDEDAENLVRKMSLTYKVGQLRSRSARTETAILNLIQKYCKSKNYKHKFQFCVCGYIYDFRCENILIEFDEPSHLTKKQKKTDENKNKNAWDNGYKIIRFTLSDDIIDMILAIDAEIELNQYE